MKTVANKREVAGIQLLKRKIEIRQVDQSTFIVQSGSDPSKLYQVKWQRKQWICNCKDFEKRHRKCKHIFALDYYLMLNEMSSSLARSALEDSRAKCPKCVSARFVIKRGFRYSRSGPEQRYFCKHCMLRFVHKTAFKWMRTRAKIIAVALDLYFRGLSLRGVQEHLEDSYGVKVTHSTIYHWLKKYVNIVSRHLARMQVTTGPRWHADEMVLRLKGQHAVFWGLLDSKERFLLAWLISKRRDTENAQLLLKKGINASRNRPLEIVTDGLPSYDPAIDTELGDSNQPIIHLQGPLSEALNNKMERFNGTLKNRLKTMQHLGSEQSAKVFGRGFAAHYNFVRRHKALGGKTPAQSAKITKGKETWLSLIHKSAQAKT